MKSINILLCVFCVVQIGCRSDFRDLGDMMDIKYGELDSVFNTRIELQFEKMFYQSDWEMNVSAKRNSGIRDSLKLAKEVGEYIQASLKADHRISTITILYYDDTYNNKRHETVLYSKKM